jgi:hypothetical protein
VVLAVVAGGCASAGGDEPAESAVDKCLADAGYSKDEVSGDLDYHRLQDPEFDAALVECYRAVGVELPAAGELTRSLDQVLLAEVRCLRDKGWDVPDPVRGPHGALNMGDLTDVIPDDQAAAFEQDDQACVENIVPAEGLHVGDPVPD